VSLKAVTNDVTQVSGVVSEATTCPSTLRAGSSGIARLDVSLGVIGPPPALLMAALGPRMLDLARELADGVVTTWVTPELIAEHVAPASGPASASWSRSSRC
jgi:hypothetical protein